MNKPNFKKPNTVKQNIITILIVCLLSTCFTACNHNSANSNKSTSTKNSTSSPNKEEPANDDITSPEQPSSSDSSKENTSVNSDTTSDNASKEPILDDEAISFETNTSIATDNFNVFFDRNKIEYQSAYGSHSFTVKDIDTKKYPNTFLSITATSEYTLSETIDGLILQSGQEGVAIDATIGQDKLPAKSFSYQEGNSPESKICEYYVIDFSDERVIIELNYYVDATQSYGNYLHSMLDHLKLHDTSTTQPSIHAKGNSKELDVCLYSTYVSDLKVTPFEAEHNFQVISESTNDNDIIPNFYLWSDIPLSSLSLVHIAYENDIFTATDTIFTATNVKELESFILYEKINDCTIPTLGVIAEDTNGVLQTYTLTESGFDGSLLLTKDTILFKEVN